MKFGLIKFDANTFGDFFPNPHHLLPSSVCQGIHNFSGALTFLAPGVFRSSVRLFSPVRLLSPVILLSPLILFSPVTLAAPQGGQVTHGSAQISTQGNQTIITQNSAKTIIDWQSFNIATHETTTFNQPSTSAIALNRIHDSSGTQIMGNLNANGQVFLINPNGVTFSRTANVNVAGLVASTLEISDVDFINGNYNFHASATNKGRINNNGHINAHTVALLGNQVTNDGWIVASSNGDIALLAADEVTLSFGANQRLGVKVTKGTIKALVENKQLLQADGGKILLRAEAADSIFGAAVNNSGIIRARTLAQVKGEIYLLGDLKHGTTTVTGTLDASASQQGDGGFIETSAAKVIINKDTRITTFAVDGKTGQWLIDPINFQIAASGGDISGAALANLLGFNNVTITTSPTSSLPASEQHLGATTSGTELGDIYVDDNVTWSASTVLTLLADNNIYINKEIKASGNNAGLILDTQLSNSAGALAFAASDALQMGENGKVTLSGENAIYKLDNKTFQVINGNNTSLSGTTALDELMSLPANTRRYLLGVDVDATSVSWTPIARLKRGFSGGGHTIDGLNINTPTLSNVAMFKKINKQSFIRDLTLTNVNVSGYNNSAALVGLSKGHIYNVNVSGSISGNNNVGGIVGRARLVGSAAAGKKGQIHHSQMSGTVTATGNKVGGLVGLSNADISHSKAIVTVNGKNSVGALVGRLNADASNSYAQGSVTGTHSHIGGLIGRLSGKLTRTYSTAAVNGNFNTGGLVGFANGAQITLSYASGLVSSSDQNSAGAFVGKSSGLTSASNNYVSTDTAQSAAFGFAAPSFGVTFLSAAQMMNASNFSGFNIGANTAANQPWYIYEGQTSPLLTGVTPDPLLTTTTPTTNPVPDLGNITNPIPTTVSPQTNNAISAVVEFDANPFGPTAAGGYSEEVATRSYFDDKMSVENGGAKRGNELSNTLFDCYVLRDPKCT